MILTAAWAGLLKWGGILLGVLTLFFSIKNSGKNEQIVNDEKATHELQEKINAVPTSNPTDVIDSLRDGKF